MVILTTGESFCPPGGIDELGAEDEAEGGGGLLGFAAVGCEPVWPTPEMCGCELDVEDEEAAPKEQEDGG